MNLHHNQDEVPIWQMVVILLLALAALVLMNGGLHMADAFVSVPISK